MLLDWAGPATITAMRTASRYSEWSPGTAVLRAVVAIAIGAALLVPGYALEVSETGTAARPDTSFESGCADRLAVTQAAQADLLRERLVASGRQALHAGSPAIGSPMGCVLAKQRATQVSPLRGSNTIYLLKRQLRV